MSQILIIVILIVLLLLSGFFSSSETAFSSLNLIRIKQFSRSTKKNKASRAKKILRINKKFSSFLTTILVANNIVNIAAASLGTYLFTILIANGERAVLVSTIVISVSVIVFSEVIPKTFARFFPEKMAMLYSPIIIVLMIVLKPLTFWATKLNLQIKDKFDTKYITATEDELMDIVETIEKEGILEHKESQLIQSAIIFDDISVKKVMLEKQNVLFLDINSTFEEIIDFFKNNRYSRLPIFDNKKNKIVGVVHQRDVFKAYINKTKNIKSIMNKPVNISHRRSLPYALEQLQKNKAHLGIVVDNLKNQKFLGIVTMEDLIEELVGEIYDEHDKTPKMVFEIGNHIFQVDGDTRISVLFDKYLIDEKKPKTKHKLVKYWIKELAGDVKEKTIIYFEDIKIKVIEEANNLAQKIEIEVLTTKEE